MFHDFQEKNFPAYFGVLLHALVLKYQAELCATPVHLLTQLHEMKHSKELASYESMF